MSNTAMDLDSSLDDIIKNKRKNNQKQRNDKGSRFKKPTPSANSKGKRLEQNKPQINARSKRISKPVARPMQSRGTSKAQPLFTAKNRPTSNAAKPDPSNIVITKAINRRLGGAGAVSRRMQSRAFKASSPPTQQRQPPPQEQPLYQPTVTSQERMFTIRGLSHTSSTNSGISIRGESGPAVVLLSNLDPGTNAEDVKTACSQFGSVLSCEVLTDRAGRSFGEAEVEFANKTAALDCIAKLDNEIADGRVLRAILRSRRTGNNVANSTHTPASSSFTTPTVRSVIAPTRSGYTSA
ncbi:hypothetical protein EC973_002248 [Apophysomyces ossiformis]|uniref:RRM domain-containing protein n=1 Tax=Apophysomyces ossiformis TaxID=679940 RepID=A0A8H7ETU5_9FUNG|nr:hypothetical protein EC973_002248 [Apophysomyces ossiformis]